MAASAVVVVGPGDKCHGRSFGHLAFSCLGSCLFMLPNYHIHSVNGGVRVLVEAPSKSTSLPVRLSRAKTRKDHTQVWHRCRMELCDPRFSYLSLKPPSLLVAHFRRLFSKHARTPHTCSPCQDAMWYSLPGACSSQKPCPRLRFATTLW